MNYVHGLQAIAFLLLGIFILLVIMAFLDWLAGVIGEWIYVGILIFAVLSIVFFMGAVVP